MLYRQVMRQVARAARASERALFSTARAYEARAPLLAADASLIGYRGKGTPDGNIGNTAAHWAAAKGHAAALHTAHGERAAGGQAEKLIVFGGSIERAWRCVSCPLQVARTASCFARRHAYFLLEAGL